MRTPLIGFLILILTSTTLGKRVVGSREAVRYFQAVASKAKGATGPERAQNALRSILERKSKVEVKSMHGMMGSDEEEKIFIPMIHMGGGGGGGKMHSEKCFNDLLTMVSHGGVGGHSNPGSAGGGGGSMSVDSETVSQNQGKRRRKRETTDKRWCKEELLDKMYHVEPDGSCITDPMLTGDALVEAKEDLVECMEHMFQQQGGQKKLHCTPGHWASRHIMEKEKCHMQMKEDGVFEVDQESCKLASRLSVRKCLQYLEGGTPMTGHSGGSSSSSGGAPAMGPSKRKKRNAGGGGGGGGGGGMMMGHTAECSAEVEACMMMMYINLAEHDMENMDDQEAALYMASLVNSPFQALMSDRAIHCIEELGHEQNDPEDLMHTPGHCREIVADLRMSAPEGKCFPDNVVNQQDLLMCLFPHADMATLTIHCPVSWTKDYMWLSHLLIECKDEVADYLATMAAGQVDGAINIDVDSCHMAKSGDPIDQCRHVLTPELNGYHDPDMDMGPPSMPRPAVVVGCIQAFMMDLNENPMDCKKLANSKWYWMAGQFDRYSEYFAEVGYEGLDCVKFEVCKDIISGMWVQNEPLPTTTEFSPPLLGGGGAGLPPPGSGGGGIPPWLLEDKRKKRNTDDMEDEDHDFCFIAPSMSVAVDAFACQALFVEDNKWVCPRVLPPELVPIFEAVLNDENCLMDFKDTMQVDDIDVDSCRMAVEHRLQECKVHGSMMTSHIPDNSVSVSNDEMMRKRKKRSSPPLPDINEWGEIAESGMVGGGGGGDMMDHGCKSMAAKECKAMVKKNIMKHEPTCEDVSYSAWGFLPGSPLADCLDEDMKVAVAQCPDPRECRKSVLDKIIETNPEHEGKIKWLKNMMQRYEGGLMTGLAKEQQMAGEFGGGHMMGHGHMKRKKRNAAGNGNGGRKCLPANAATLLRDCLPFKGVDATVRCPAKPDSEWFFWAFVIDHLPGCADEIKTIMQVDIDVQSCKTAYENARDKMTETFLKEMDCVYQMQPLNDEDSKFLRNWLDDNDNKVICKGDPFVPFLNRIIDQNKFCYAYFYMDLKKASPDQSCMPMDHCTEQCRFLENLLSGNTGTILDDFDIDKLFANTDFCGVMTANAVSEHKESYYQLGSLGMSTTTTTTEAGGKTTATTESGGSKTSPTLAATAILTLVLAKFIIIF